MNSKATLRSLPALLCLIASCILVAWVCFRLAKPATPTEPQPPALPKPSPVVTNAGDTTPPSAAELARRKARFTWFQKHPFTATHEAAAFGWTSEDGKNPDVIKQLAHNELEFERMADESDRILRRQLVYHKDTVDAQIERAKLTGQPIRQLTLPGLDGQEVQFEITQTDLNPSGQSGAFAGHVPGKLDSLVTLAFKGGREAFTVLSPSDSLYLVGEPREPGELIVKSINPNTYVPGVCGTP
jgi:hypothetical protein